MDYVWTHLNAAQADGLACVMCELPTSGEGWSGVPVGRSASGSQVFACSETCTEEAETVRSAPLP